MANSIAVFVAVLTLAATDQGEVARYTFTAGWPSKATIQSLDVDSSAPGLASGSYRLDLEVNNQRLIGRLQRGNDTVESIPFSIQGCEKVKTPNWARRATVRGLAPAAGQSTRRVVLRIAETTTSGCAITAVFTPVAGFTARADPVPGGKPNPGGPDQQAAKLGLPDLSIRQAQADPKDPTKIRVQIVNEGPGAAAATQVKLDYTKNGVVTTGQAAVPALAAKGTAWVSVGAGLPIAAADTVSARVDEPNIVSETNELNNTIKFK